MTSISIRVAKPDKPRVGSGAIRPSAFIQLDDPILYYAWASLSHQLIQKRETSDAKIRVGSGIFVTLCVSSGCDGGKEVHISIELLILGYSL